MCREGEGAKIRGETPKGGKKDRPETSFCEN